MDIQAKLNELGLTLPAPAKPVAVYVPVVQTGNLLFISGQLPTRDGELTCSGTVPSQVNLEQAKAAAQQCVLNAIAIIDDHLGGDWSRFVRFVRLGGFVASDSGFTDQPVVINGASETLEKVFGQAGQHARAAVGSIALPKNSPVEIEFIVEIR